MPDERDRASAGFTLIELVVLLSILAVIAAMAVPFLGNSIPRTTLRATAAEIRAALGTARSEAIAQGRTIVFRGDRYAGYWVDNRYHRLATTADPGVRLRVAAGGGGQLSFFAWGGSSGGRVRIEAPYGRRDIAVDAVSGRAVLRP